MNPYKLKWLKKNLQKEKEIKRSCRGAKGERMMNGGKYGALV